MKYIICIFLGLSFFSCNEEKWLKEKPYDFYAPENSYETVNDFKQAVNYMFDLLRYWHFVYADHGYQHQLYLGSDIFYNGWPNSLDDPFNSYHPYINSTTAHVQKNWSYFYNVVAKSNEVLTMLETNASQVSDAAKVTFKGEALFFRAYYHRLLAHIWGDVPLVTEMVTTPKNDYIRSARDAVYEQCQLDLEEAVRCLADIDKVADGAVSKQVAQHILAEVYISRGNYTEAIEAATDVINHPATGLMKERFGSLKDQPYDVFYDLFRAGNQNRSKGNKEGLLVLQYDYLSGSPYDCNFSRYLIPQTRTARVKGKDSQGQDAAVLACPDFNAEDGGRGNGYFSTTHHFRQEVWGADFDKDIRNSSYNIFRDFRIDNPSADGYGQWLLKDGWLAEVDTFAFVYPAVTKYCAFEAYPASSLTGKTTSLGKRILVNSGTSAIGSFKDEYLIRLSETYLLLAEAYVLNNRPVEAAAAINEIRDRAGATPATPGEMNIDYILDERMRELAGEEVRNVTLFRMGKFVERARRYSPCGYHVADHQNLWPIPYSEIEKNTGAVLTQNQGYGVE